MEPIVRLEGPGLSMLVQSIANVENRINGGGGIYRMRFAIDDGGIKVKINEGVWSPPLGEIERG
jgi:hypothetical protein